MKVLDIIRSADAEPCFPGLRHILTLSGWTAMAEALANDPLVLLAFWADASHVHALFLDEADEATAVVSTLVVGGFYPALSPVRAGASLFERTIHDLWGHTAAGGVDTRPWLDHSFWGQTRPLSARPGIAPATAGPPDLNADIQAREMQLPIGPVWGMIEEASHLRLTLRGEAVVRAESRFGYAHKATLALMRGKTPRIAARFAARLSGDSTVAHSIAFAEATEAALGIVAPPRALVLRGIMAEMERIAGHLDDLASMSFIAQVGSIRRACGQWRETWACMAQAAFGHRLMMDCVVPGGLAIDIEMDAPDLLGRILETAPREMERLSRSHEAPGYTNWLAGLGPVEPNCAAIMGAGGIVGRSSGRSFDVRRLSLLYQGLSLPVRVLRTGDALARCQMRLIEIADSLRLLQELLEILPDGPVSVTLPMTSGEGIGAAESFRGDVWYWLHLDHGQISGVFPRDPSWAILPLAERALVGASMEDVKLIRRSFGLSVPGMDL